jgi:DNA-directed RNA polymerase subunit M/transcription elongation factor TFIIS
MTIEITNHLPELRACAVWQIARLVDVPCEKALFIEGVLHDFVTRDFEHIPVNVQWDHEQVRKSYRNKLYEICSNALLQHSTMKSELVSSQSTEDIIRVLEKDHKQFAKALWEDLMNKQQVTEKVEEELFLESQIECFRCKKAEKYSRNVETTQVQTRSADEPMTVFCVCRGCGQRWRM